MKSWIGSVVTDGNSFLAPMYSTARGLILLISLVCWSLACGGGQSSDKSVRSTETITPKTEGQSSKETTVEVIDWPSYPKKSRLITRTHWIKDILGDRRSFNQWLKLRNQMTTCCLLFNIKLKTQYLSMKLWVHSSGSILITVLITNLIAPSDTTRHLGTNSWRKIF